jgi:putative acetyltransferase
MNMIIRRETRDDGAGIRAVVADAFGQPAEADLVDALRTTGDVIISLVAERQGAAVGHVLFSALQAPRHCLALAPVAVSPGHQNQGVGVALIREGLAQAARDDWKAVFVLGEPEYYTRFGFSVATTEAFETEYPRPYFMALELAPNALKDESGPVIYASPFLALE